MRTALFLLALLTTLNGWTQSASPPYTEGPPSRDGIGRRFHGREIARVMGAEGAEWLERSERAEEERPELLVQALHLRPDMTVADIGAGSGYLTRRISAEVPQGRVYAVDVQPEMIRRLEALAREPGRSNIIPVLSRPDDPQLPPRSVDVALMVDVYHELRDPAALIRRLLVALKPGGQLVLVEYRGEDPTVPIKALHKMTETQVRMEMADFPLVWDHTDDRLPVQHLIVFRKAKARD